MKNKKQVDGLTGTTSYSGIRDCISKTYRTEGLHGFFIGMPSTLLRSFPVNATTFFVVASILRWTSPSPSPSPFASNGRQESSVTYQDAASLVHESLAATATFAHERSANSAGRRFESASSP